MDHNNGMAVEVNPYPSGTVIYSESCLAHNAGAMGAIAGLGLILAIVMGMIAMAQIDSLQDLSKLTTSGGVNTLFGTTTFLFLLVVVVVAISGIVGALMWMSGRR